MTLPVLPGIDHSFGKIFPKFNWGKMGDFLQFQAGNPGVSEQHSRLHSLRAWPD